MKWSWVDWKEVLLGCAEGFILSMIMFALAMGAAYAAMGIYILIHG